MIIFIHKKRKLTDGEVHKNGQNKRYHLKVQLNYYSVCATFDVANHRQISS